MCDNIWFCQMASTWKTLSEIKTHLLFDGKTQTGQLNCNSVLYWRKKWQPTPVLLPGESHGWRSLVGDSPWGHRESDTTERLHSFTSVLCFFTYDKNDVRRGGGRGGE